MVRAKSGGGYGAARDQRTVAFPAVYINPLANYGTLVGVAILGHDGIDHELLRDRAHEVLGEVRGYTLEALVNRLSLRARLMYCDSFRFS